jgi:hypothetical protein
MTAATEAATSTTRRPGNATKRHDNRRVSAFVAAFDTVSDLCEEFPAVGDILTGVSWLKSPGHTATRPLSRRMLFLALVRCQFITTESTALATDRSYSRTQVERYAAHARVASKAIAQLLDRQPNLETRAQAIIDAKVELDAPYMLQLQSQGLLS